MGPPGLDDRKSVLGPPEVGEGHSLRQEAT